MKLTQIYRTIKVSSSFFILIFTFFSVLWIYTFNRYHVLGFQEETQLFRTDYFYFYDYITRPGGLIAYIASFFTQFYGNFLIGAIILSLTIAGVYLLSLFIFLKKGVTGWACLLTGISPVLLLLTSADPNIRLSNMLSLCLILSLFLIYLNLKDKYRYWWGIGFYLISYFVTGGNAILLIALLVTDELFFAKRSFLYIAGLLIVGVTVPYFSYLFVYITTPANAYKALTPYMLDIDNKFYKAAWLYIPLSYLLWCWLTRKETSAKEKKVWKQVIVSYLLIIGLSVWGVLFVTDKNKESISHMAYEVERGNWDKVIELGRKYNSSENAVLVSYFMNIAYSEKGMIGSNMFDYQQTGSLGLFLSWTRHYSLISYTGELYYRMGIIPEGEHCAFESLVISPNEHGSKPLRRLVYTNMIRRDKDGFEKYIRLFEKSPVYKQWAKEQRSIYQQYEEGSLDGLSGFPEFAAYNDFYINYDQPEYNLIVMLRTDTGNKKVFEYLMASILLQKQLNTFLAGMEKYFEDMSYTQIPKHLEEALIVCRYNLKDKEDILRKYPVRKETLEKFIKYAEESQMAKNDVALKRLKEKYGDTFWFYYQYVNPMTLEKAKVESRY